MDNPYPVYGIELHIADTPESITAVDVTAGEAVADLDGTISFSEVNGELIILWFSLTGQYIETIYNGFAFKGEMYTFEWDASHVSSGVYIIRLESSNIQTSNFTFQKIKIKAKN